MVRIRIQTPQETGDSGRHVWCCLFSPKPSPSWPEMAAIPILQWPLKARVVGAANIFEVISAAGPKIDLWLYDNDLWGQIVIIPNLYTKWDGFLKWGYPIAGWFIMENAIKKDDNWGYPHDLGNHQVGWLPCLSIWNNISDRPMMSLSLVLYSSIFSIHDPDLWSYFTGAKPIVVETRNHGVFLSENAGSLTAVYHVHLPWEPRQVLEILPVWDNWARSDYNRQDYQTLHSRGFQGTVYLCNNQNGIKIQQYTRKIRGMSVRNLKNQPGFMNPGVDLVSPWCPMTQLHESEMTPVA